MGEKVTAFSRELYGDPTWPIVSKKFDNLNPIPHHLHWSKWEVYDINSFDNPGVCPSHYHTTAMGLYPFVSKDDFLASMKSFGQGEYNGVRHLLDPGSLRNQIFPPSTPSFHAYLWGSPLRGRHRKHRLHQCGRPK